MDESRFWSMIESAWKSVGGKVKARQQLAEGKLSEEKAEELEETLEEVIPALRAELVQLLAEELLAFDRILERKLYDIDREEIHAYTDGSDDGFLYARGFIVALGKAYYDAVNSNPAVGVDLECEEMCYLSWEEYRVRYGDVSSSGISRESCSNHAAWPRMG
jgi:hypothetical protein